MTPSSVRVYPVGGSLPVGGFDMVTPYARAPVPIAMAPGPTKTFVDAVPEPDRDASTGRVDTASTPLYAESNMPPSVTGWVNVACTAYTTAGSGLGSGNPWMLVATYVAIEMPPLETNPTRRNVLPTGVRATLVMKSLTDVMVLVPDQKMVATIASPRCGGAPLNPFARTLVSRSFSVPTCASSAIAVPGATGASVAAEIRGRVRAGPVGDTASREQPATIKAAATNAARGMNELRVCIHCLMWSVRYTLITLHLRKLCATSPRALRALRECNSHQLAARRSSGRTTFPASVARLRQSPRDDGTEGVGEGERQASPACSGNAEHGPVGSRRRRDIARRPLCPWQRHVGTAPLLLEAVRAATRRAAAEVEMPDAAADQMRHEGPVQQHVRSSSAVLAQ